MGFFEAFCVFFFDLLFDLVLLLPVALAAASAAAVVSLRQGGGADALAVGLPLAAAFTKGRSFQDLTLTLSRVERAPPKKDVRLQNR